MIKARSNSPNAPRSCASILPAAELVSTGSATNATANNVTINAHADDGGATVATIAEDDGEARLVVVSGAWVQFGSLAPSRAPASSPSTPAASAPDSDITSLKATRSAAVGRAWEVTLELRTLRKATTAEVPASLLKPKVKAKAPASTDQGNQTGKTPPSAEAEAAGEPTLHELGGKLGGLFK